MNYRKPIVVQWRQTENYSWLKPVLWLALVGALLFLGRLTPTADAALRGESTIPSDPAHLTVLVGPIDEMTDTLWTVAGVAVEIKSSTRFNERMDRAGVGMWARVEGYPAPEEGLVATRIKILPPHPFISIQGRLQELSATAAKVGGIPVQIGDHTRLLGNPTVGIRVRVIAGAEDYEPDLIALRIQRAGDPYDDDVDDAEEADGTKVELIGQMQDRPEDSIIGLWKISTIQVDVRAETEVKEQVSELLSGAWVKVEGHSDGGMIIASEVKSTDTRDYHKLEGTLDSLDDDTIVINGITLTLAGNVKIEGDPQPGDRVEIRAQLIDENLVVTHVEGEGTGDNHGHHESDTRHISGRVQYLPDDLLGEWQVGNYRVLVDGVTQIYQSKGQAEKGAVVRVEVLKGTEDPLTAIEVVVLNSGNGDQNNSGGQEIELTGLIDSLPNRGLIGTWMVDGQAVQVTPKTEIEDEDYIGIGVEVEVKGRRSGNGPIHAEKIKVLND